MQQRLIAMRPFRYAGRQLKAGDPFDAKTATDARAWKAIRFARDAPPEPPPKPPPKAEKPEKPEPGADNPRYRTRRLKADDD